MPAFVTPLTSCLAGRWLSADPSRLVTRENPGRFDETACRWSPATIADAQAALDAAATAFPSWASESLAERHGLLTRLLDAVETNAGEFVTLITRENGKPRRDAQAEVTSALGDARQALAYGLQAGLVEPAPPVRADVRGELHLEPLGVCVLITPWNFPLATVLRKLVPALLYGNPAVVKPSELAPGPVCRLFALLNTLPFPPGTASLLLGAGADLGPALTGHAALRAISFTGSNAAGASLARATAGRDVRLQLEMGGKNTLVVLADADLDAATEAAVVGGFTCAGQWCTGTGRVVVEQSVHDAFLERLVARLPALRLGPGDDEATTLGPVVTAARADFARAIVATSTAAGARAHAGGPVPAGGHFVAPTVLEGVTPGLRAFADELFVPVLPVTGARDADDAIRLANAGPYGLSASVFSRDIARATARARQIEAGIVHVNLHTAYREPALSVAGWRESGRGLPECGRFARDFFARPRALYVRP